MMIKRHSIHNSTGVNNQSRNSSIVYNSINFENKSDKNLEELDIK